MPGRKILLLAPNTPEGIAAQRLLQDKKLDFLVVRPDNVLTEDDEESEPVLMAGEARLTGMAAIRDFVHNYAEQVDAEKIGRTVRVLKDLGVEPVMTAFSARLRIQKIVYLLQEFGLQTKWNFSWYMRGPYSPDLAHELFERHEKSAKGPIIRDDETKALRRFREKFGNSQLTAQELEAAAAVVFVAKSTGARSSALIARVREQKPYLPKQLIEEYVERLYP